jgi:V/A-type H+-transporting ATPase subunit D
MLANDQAPTRSAILQLRDEQGIIDEAYDFLDEKRLLLAAEVLRQLNDYERLLREYEQLREQAEQLLVAAVRRHGLRGVQIYPSRFMDNADMRSSQSSFMGVTLVTAELQLPEYDESAQVVFPSPETEQCRQVFVDMVQQASVIAAVSGNLHRLLEEYRRTERRARALENIVIPEIAQQLQTMSTQLEELDQEDIVRVHLKHKGKNKGNKS